MLHILFTILKIPFILLAVILLLILLAMVLVLFVPVRYRITAKKDADIYAAGRITWLLHMVTVLFEYSEKQAHFQIKLFGYPLFGEKSSRRHEPDERNAENMYPEITEQTDGDREFEEAEILEKPDMPEEAEILEKPDVPEEAEEQEEPENLNDVENLKAEAGTDETDITDETDSIDKTDSADETDITKEPDAGVCKLSKLWQKIKAFFERLLERLRNINDTIQSFKSKLDYYKRMWYDKHTQASWHHLKKEIVYLLRHIRPKKADGWIRIGLDDPAVTGQVLGLLCILQSLSGNHLTAEADFNEKVLEGDFQLKGHIRFCHFLKAVSALLLDKHCRITFKRIRKLL